MSAHPKILIEDLTDQFVDGDLIGLFAEGEFGDAEFLEAAKTHLLKEYGADVYKIIEPVERVRWRRHPRQDGDLLKPGRGPGSFIATKVKVE